MEVMVDDTVDARLRKMVMSHVRNLLVGSLEWHGHTIYVLEVSRADD